VEEEIHDAASGNSQSQATQFNVTGSSGTFNPENGLGNGESIHEKYFT